MFEPPSGLKTVRPSNSFFDWASLSPLSTAAASARSASVDAANQQVDAPEHVRHETASLDDLRDVIVQFAGARHLDPCVALGRSVSEFMSVLAHGLPRRPNRSKIALVGLTHPSVVIAWRAASEVLGFDVALYGSSGSAIIDPLELAQVIDERTLAVVTTHVDHLHGEEQQLSTVVGCARRAGAISIVDGAQAVGRVQLNLDAASPDVYIGSGRKALLSYLGTAFMLVNRDVMMSIRPALWSTRSAQLSPDGEVVVAPGASRLEGNLPDLASLAGLRANVELMTPEVIALLSEYVDGLMPALIASLSAAGLSKVNSGSTVRNAGIASFRVPPRIDGLELQRWLKERGLVVAATPTSIRVSLHFANTLADVRRLSEEVARNAA